MNLPIRRSEPEFEPPSFLESRKDELHPLKKELAERDGMIADLMDDLAEARKEIETLQEENAKLEMKIFGLEYLNEFYFIRIEALQRERDALRKKLEDINA